MINFLKKNFKGQLDLVSSAEFLIFGFVIMLIVVVILLALSNGFGSTPEGYITTPIFNAGLGAMVLLGNSIVIIYLLMNLIAVMSAFYTDSHPMFTLISILGLIISWIIIYAFSLVFAHIIALTFLYQIATLYFPAVLTVILLLPVFTILFAFLIIIALNGKASNI